MALACKNPDADTTASFIYEQIFCQFGPPTHILSDFDNTIIEKFLYLHNVHCKFSTPYHPQTNGKCEKLNGTLTASFKKLSIAYPNS